MTTETPTAFDDSALAQEEEERLGITGNYPVYAETPLMDEFLEKDARAAAKETEEH